MSQPGGNTISCWPISHLEQEARLEAPSGRYVLRQIRGGQHCPRSCSVQCHWKGRPHEIPLIAARSTSAPSQRGIFSIDQVVPPPPERLPPICASMEDRLPEACRFHYFNTGSCNIFVDNLLPGFEGGGRIEAAGQGESETDGRMTAPAVVHNRRP